MDFTVILTSYKEPESIKKAIENLVRPNLDLIAHGEMQLIVVAPDDETIAAAKEKLVEFTGFNDYLVLRDKAVGKPAAINYAIEKAKNPILVLTDGDMHVSHNAIRDLIRYFEAPRVGGVSGHPVSLDSRNTQFGYYSHLFCEAAHQKRLLSDYVPMSGYLYAVRNIKALFPIPEEVRAEDAYISAKILSAGYEIKYEPQALAYVHFPKNLRDWFLQKKRSIGGNVQSARFTANSPQESRSIFQDLKNGLFPVKFAKTFKEMVYSLLLYPLRLYLWISIYVQHFLKGYSKGAWERIESSKQ